MKKYFEIFRTTISLYFVYRLNFILWRFRKVLNLLLLFFLWDSVFSINRQLFGYTKNQMITYILLFSLISDIVISTRTIEVAGEIVSGDIVNYILKPFSFFKFQFTRDISDKLVNMAFSVVELLGVLILFKPTIQFQNDPLSYLLLGTFLVGGIFIAFFFNLALSFIGFWTTETWAPRFIYYMIILFLSGTYFPIDMLPKPLYYLLLATPFPYFSFFPVRLFLGSVPLHILIYGTTMCILWLYASYWMSTKLWNKGLKSYSFFGK